MCFFSFASFSQLGSYFGATVCAVDLNADGLSDLLVGAPMFSAVREEGRVHIYMNQGQVSKLSSPRQVTVWWRAGRSNLHLCTFSQQ